MNYRVVLRVLGFLTAAMGAALLIPALTTLLYDGRDLAPLLIAAVIPLGLGLVLLLGTRGGRVDLGAKESFLIVTLGWLVAALFGALPYLFTGACSGFTDAFFESMSGFTTTGSTILVDIEALSHGVLLWRSLTQWLGGMGIILLSVAVLPFLGIGGMALYKAEVPGPTADRLTPRIQNAAKTLWMVYFILTLVQTVLLMAGGMNLFESVCHTFTTLSTGGFSTRNASVGGFDSLYIELVVLVFMFVSGVNFSLHMWPVRRGVPRYLGNEEFRLYGGITLLSIAAVTAGLVWGLEIEVGDALRQAAFQVVSILTTTGYATTDYLLWGFGSQVLLFCLMFLGGSAGSTAGGMKMMRIAVLTKHGFIQAKKELHPRAIYKLRYGGSVVPDDVTLRILAFFLLYMSVFFVVSLCLAAMGLDFETALGASIASLSNIGPGLGGVGPVSTFAGVPELGKLLLSANMLLGRLELYTVLVLLTPAFWKRI